MRKYCSIALSFCLICSLAVTAFAAYDISGYIDEYSMYFPEPVPEDYGGICPEFMDAHDAWVYGLQAYAEEQENAKSPPDEEPAAEESLSEPAPIKPTESAGANYAVSSTHVNTPVDTGPDDKYPVGSWVDPAGNVYSPSGELLSPGTTPAVAPAEKLSAATTDSDFSSASPDAEPLPVIDEAVQPVWYVEDLRPAAAPVDVLAGLKSMVTSIFGEYTPITTTSVISETVGNETRQYLVETVAPGAAGVDYEWIAGVVLFGIMLFCLMKLLGGVIK